MRKIIKIHLYLGGIIGLLLSFSIAISNTRFSIIMFGISLIYAISMMLCGTILSTSGLDRNWFKTQEELNNQLKQATRSWDKAEKLMKILGEQESIKLWHEIQRGEIRKEAEKLNRVEVIDENGRSYVNWNKDNKVQVDFQDDNQTLKIFVRKINTDENS